MFSVTLSVLSTTRDIVGYEKLVILVLNPVHFFVRIFLRHSTHYTYSLPRETWLTRNFSFSLTGGNIIKIELQLSRVYTFFIRTSRLKITTAGFSASQMPRGFRQSLRNHQIPFLLTQHVQLHQKWSRQMRPNSSLDLISWPLYLIFLESNISFWIKFSRIF